MANISIKPGEETKYESTVRGTTRSNSSWTGQPLTPSSSKQTSPSPSCSSIHERAPFQAIKPEEAEHIWAVTGPAGCGKTTIAKFLAHHLALPYLEGDDYHTDAAKAKMGSGQALNDSDRWDWLIALREAAIQKLTTPSSEVSAHGKSLNRGVILTCSALKKRYREVLQFASQEHARIQVHIIYLKADQQMLLDRVAARQGHYMKAGMVQSQFEDLEEPDESEGDVLVVDVGAAPEVVQARALEAVQAKLKEYEA